jgi:hypothetical protein
MSGAFITRRHGVTAHPPTVKTDEGKMRCLSFAEQDVYYDAWWEKRSSIQRFFLNVGHYLLLNGMVVELVEDEAEPLKRLTDVYNLVGLIEALLLSMGITPLQDIKNWARDDNIPWPLSPTQAFCQKFGAYVSFLAAPSRPSRAFSARAQTKTSGHIAVPYARAF